MTTRPSRTSELDLGDLIVLYKGNDSDYRAISVPDFIKSINDQLKSNKPTTQYASPNATGFDVLVESDFGDIHLIMTPLATYATGTITLPNVQLLSDKQEVTVNTTQTVTALTINPNGATVIRAPTTLSANGFFKLSYDEVMKTWYRVG